MPLWLDTLQQTYTTLFGEARSPPPPDRCQSPSLKDYGIADVAENTNTITPLHLSSLTHHVGAVQLNLAFVQQVLDTTGPILTQSEYYSAWHFSEQPRNLVVREAVCEADFYPWFEWALCAPAAHAVNAVRDKLYQAADQFPEGGFDNDSETATIRNQTMPGSTDILHRLVSNDTPPIYTNCTPHEFKRSYVLQLDGESALEYLVTSAAQPRGHRFQLDAELATLRGKSRRTVNEMVAYDTGHAIMCTQDEYVMLRLTTDFQLEISRVYKTHTSATQASDMAELVLFYTHAALRAGTRFSQKAQSTMSQVFTSMRVMVPAFPTALFQPYEAVFRDCGLSRRTQLIALPNNPRSLFPFRWIRFDGELQFPSPGHDVSISHGSVLFFFLAARVVAKTAHDYRAARRLRHEFNAYARMRDLQGAVIPRVVGLYRRKDENKVVLLITYAGKPLKTFDDLPPLDRRTLFQRLVRLHGSGIQHNDFEPRNVTMFGASNPVIIDFDNASLHHRCTGASCAELIHVAKLLGLDITRELNPEHKQPTDPYAHFIIVIVLFSMFVLLSLVYGLARLGSAAGWLVAKGISFSASSGVTRKYNQLRNIPKYSRSDVASGCSGEHSLVHHGPALFGVHDAMMYTAVN
ncbi:hypothetical protein DFH07DRAFT_781159 [Mycena maculata]|uniref:Protein kinase domain-containing protein n=1 Tax=Mycena maculata TaxID=230809 RepID=A0AAD7HZI0_9AGAR|nr:hypothetical protein DFH07DRAFT_781159 [Mycena maculata]